MNVSPYSNFPVFDLFGKCDPSFFSPVDLQCLEKEDSNLLKKIRKTLKIIRVRRVHG